MAENHCEGGQECSESLAVVENETSKRCSSEIPNTAPPHKFPKTDSPSPTRQASYVGEEIQTENPEEPTSPTVTARRKSWRRATVTRRSLPALPNQYQVLCKSISASLSHQERLEELMEASMKLAIERTQNALQSSPKASLESFHQQVEHIQKEWGIFAKSIRSEPHSDHLPARTARASGPLVQSAMEKVRKSINRLQAESEYWEALFNKHRNKAEELERKVEQGQESGLALDSSSLTLSSQYQFIQSKPDYHEVLCRQQPTLHTMVMIMDTQCKMVGELAVVKEQSQLLVKETSGRLASKAGFQDLTPDIIRKLMEPPLSSATR